MMQAAMRIDSGKEFVPCSICYLCGREGTFLYRGMKDYLYGVEGEWAFKKCADTQCGFVWLDPMPSEDHVGKLYCHYYTHEEERIKSEDEIGIRLLKRAIRLPYSVLKRFVSVRSERKRLNLMYLGRVPHGKLLEIGCGSGYRLSQLRTLGWNVEGQDIDPKSVARAREVEGLTVHLGKLSELSLPADTYDAVIMNHVIEHVHDPVRFLAECRRVMRPGGTLVAVTPNVQSYGHTRFQVHWRGLEPPRHLQLFAPRTLSITAEKAGFQRYEVWTSAARAETFARESAKLRICQLNGGEVASDLRISIRAMIFQIQARIIHNKQPLSGEECVLRALK